MQLGRNGWPSVAEHLEPAGWAEPTGTSTEDDFTPAPKTCPHCHLFYKVEPGWEIEQQGAGWKAELVLWGRCSNCGGYIERTEKHG